jgi:hypothetical protein
MAHRIGDRQQKMREIARGSKCETTTMGMALRGKGVMILT